MKVKFEVELDDKFIIQLMREPSNRDYATEIWQEIISCCTIQIKRDLLKEMMELCEREGFKFPQEKDIE